MSKFKIGDTVRLRDNSSWARIKQCSGKVGRVTYVYCVGRYEVYKIDVTHNIQWTAKDLELCVADVDFDGIEVMI